MQTIIASSVASLADLVNGAAASVVAGATRQCDDQVGDRTSCVTGGVVMLAAKPLLVAAVFVVGCGGSNGSKSGGMPDLAPGPTVIGQHGIVVDYFQRTPLVGFTVSDGSASATTDAQGNFLLPAPTGVVLAPTVTGASYTQLFLPEVTAAGADVDRGFIPIPSSQTFMLEQNILKNDAAKAIVYVTVAKTGACTAIAGGTLTVQSPPGTSVAYFNEQGLPTANAFTEVSGNRPAAVVYDVPPGAYPVVTIGHPTCTAVPDGTVVNGQILDGHVKTQAAEPGDYNSAMVIALH
jgi:hypothetical protein